MNEMFPPSAFLHIPYILDVVYILNSSSLISHSDEMISLRNDKTLWDHERLNEEE